MKKPFNEDEDYYYNSEGYIVLTEQYHLARGYCCGNGCRHCPYDYKNVPEPRRSKLLQERKNNSASEGNNDAKQQTEK